MIIIDVLFINPRDLSVPTPYAKTALLAAVLIDGGYNCKIIEPAAEDLSVNNILEIILKFNPKIICVSIFPSTLPDGYRLIKKIIETYPDVRIVIEGYMINADRSVVLKTNSHYGIFGDCEYTLLDLANYVIKNKNLNLLQIDGLAINDNGVLIETKPAFIKDLNVLPTPAFNLLPIGKYYTASSNKRFMIMFTDRGCPYDCSFCANASQLRYRYLNTTNVIKQIKVLVEQLGVEYLEFMDLTFTINKRRTLEICNAIIESKLKFEWACETRADLLDIELLQKMKEAGCYKITIGVESGNEKIRFATGKKIDNQKFMDTFRLCEKVGIKTMANFIFGHPNETIKNIFETIKFSIKINPFNVLFTKMTPLPDVELYFNLRDNNKIPADLWYRYMKNQIPFPVHYPETIGKFKMELLYSLAYVIFYFRLSSFLKYFSMFSSPRFAYFSIKVLLRFIFGTTIYK